MKSSNVEMNVINEEEERNDRLKDRKVLFVSGLRNDINKTILRNYFRTCTRIILKANRRTSNVKYAFVIHRTRRDAQRNLERSIDYQILGQQCQIQYSNLHLNQSNVNLFVKQIPSDVSLFDFTQLFPHCQILEYHPAQLIQQPFAKLRKG